LSLITQNETSTVCIKIQLTKPAISEAPRTDPAAVGHVPQADPLLRSKHIASLGSFGGKPEAVPGEGQAHHFLGCRYGSIRHSGGGVPKPNVSTFYANEMRAIAGESEAGR
jgi:hypothetical protein